MPAGGYRGGRGGNHRYQQKSKPALNETDESNPILLAFRSYAQELDAKHDRYERIVKISRDITIESKRIIFLLHTIDGRKNNRDKILTEADSRLQKVIETNFKAVAKELIGQDVYQYKGAYSAGLQEFIEAYTFMEYFKSGSNVETCENATQPTMSDWNDLQAKMQYEDKLDLAIDKSADEENSVEQKNDDENIVKYGFHVEPTEYILGLSDLTGELMRRCINSLGSGETDTCLETCKALQQFYTGR